MIMNKHICMTEPRRHGLMNPLPWFDMKSQRCHECTVYNYMFSTHEVYLHLTLSSLQALEWIHDTGEFYLSTHTSTGSSIHHTQELLKEHEDFQITAKVCCVYA